MILPAPAVGRHLADAAPTGRQVLPEPVEVGRLRIATAHADDRDIERHGALRRGIRLHAWRFGRCRCGARCGFRPARRETTPFDMPIPSLRRYCRSVRRSTHLRRGIAGHDVAPGEHRHHHRPVLVEEMAHQSVDALNLEEQGAAHAREQRPEPRGQLDYENAVQSVLLERTMRLDLARVHAQRRRDHLAEQRRAGFAQARFVAAVDRRGRRPYRCRPCGHGYDGLRGGHRHGGPGTADAGRSLAPGQYRHDRRPILVEEMAHEAVDGLHLEEQRAADIGEHHAELRGQLDDEDAVQSVLFERTMRLDVARIHAQRRRDDLAEPCRAGLAQCGIVGRDRDRDSRGECCRLRQDRCRCGRARDGARRNQALADHAVAARDHDLLPQAMIVACRETDVAEALQLQKPFPLPGRQARAAGQAQRFIFEQPPAIEEAEGEMGVPAPLADLVDQHDAAAFEQRLGVAHRFAHVRGGVQHVGGDHRVVAIALDRLQRERLAHVEDRGAQCRKGRLVDLLRMQQEGPGEICVAILFDQIAEIAQDRQQDGGGAAGAGADLQQAQASLAPRGPGRELGAQMFAEGTVEMIGDGIVLVDPLDHAHRRFGEHHVGRGHGALEDPREISQAGIDQDEIGAMARVPAPARHRFIPGLPQRFDVGDCGEPAARPVDGEQAVAFEMTQACVKPSAVGGTQAGKHLGRHAIALCVGEEVTELRSHERRGQALGVCRQAGGFELGGCDMQRRLSARCSLVRCIHAEYHIPVEFVDRSRFGQYRVSSDETSPSSAAAGAMSTRIRRRSITPSCVPGAPGRLLPSLTRGCRRAITAHGAMPGACTRKSVMRRRIQSKEHDTSETDTPNA